MEIVIYILLSVVVGAIFQFIIILFKKDSKPQLEDGEHITYHDNGQMMERFQVKDGKYNGFGESWYENGQKQMEINHKGGVPHGDNKLWYENGNKEQEGQYIDGKQQGAFTFWWENGNKKQESNWVDGKLEGALNSWLIDGTHSSTVVYQNGEKVDEKLSNDFSNLD